MAEYAKSLVAIERLTIDYFPARLNLPRSQASMHFISEVAWKRIQRRMPPFTKWAPGGTVGNALVAFSSHTHERRAAWAGVYDSDYRCAAALRAMAEIGIENHGTCAPGCSTEVAIVPRRTQEPSLFIKLGRWPARTSLDRVADDSTILLGLDAILEPAAPSHMWRDGRCTLAILVNHTVRGNISIAPLLDLLRADRVCLLVGRADELAVLGKRAKMRWEEWSSAWHCDCLGTLGAEGVVGYQSGTSLRIEIPAAAVPAGVPLYPLGAGDAFAGAYLGRRLERDGFVAAIEAGVQEAARVLQEPEARPSQPIQVRERTVISPILETLKTIRRDIDWGAGVVVVSGGQTGTDQIALSAATRNVIAAHAVMPQGLRSENGALQPADLARLGNPRVHELPEPGYRQRTWASAYVTDATLLFRSHESSGALETRRACRDLGRPLLELEIRPLPDPGRASSWLEQNNVRVINVAGHRGSLLTDEDASAIRTFLDSLLLDYAQAFAATHLPSVLCEYLSGGRKKPVRTRRGEVLRLAVPSSGEMRRQCLARLRLQEEALSREEPIEGLRVYSGRVRDMGVWLNEGLVDAAVGGLDDLVEGGASGKLLLDFGICRSSILLISTGAPFSASRPFHNVVSQTPKLARRLLDRNRIPYKKVTAIWGGAETWMMLAEADACVDTWHTGKTATGHGLVPLANMAETSMGLVVREDMETHELQRFRSLFDGTAQAEY